MNFALIELFQAEDDEDEQMDQDEEPQMQVVLHEVQFFNIYLIKAHCHPECIAGILCSWKLSLGK